MLQVIFSRYITLVLIIWLILFNVNDLWSLSSDVACHYLITYRISELLGLPINDPTLAPAMSIYLFFSHILAAICGKFFGSPFLGMQLITLSSVILLWASFAFIIKSLPTKTATLTLFLLAGILVLNKYFLHIEIHGYEIIVNFFFPQMLAQALFFFVVAVTIRNEQIDTNPVLRYFIALMFIPLLCWVHLLPALELLGFLLFLMIIDIFHANKEVRKKQIILASSIIIVAIASTIFYPGFSAMLKCSDNNGYLCFRYLNSLNDILLLCLITAFISSMLLYNWFKFKSINIKRKYLLYKYASLYGLVVSGLCILQFIALYLGYGSEYAVKKYGFGLNTALLVNTVFLSVNFFQTNKIIKSINRLLNKFSFLSCMSFPVFLLISFFSIIPKQKTQAVSSVVSFEKQIEILNFVNLKNKSEKYDLILNINGFNPVLSFMFSTAVLKTPWDDSEQILSGKIPTNFSKIGNIVTSENSKPYDIKECRSFGPTNSLVIVDGECVSSHLDKLKKCQDTYDFTSSGWISAEMISGFSSAESPGTWTQGKVASFQCNKPKAGEKQPNKVTITASGFITKNHSQRAIFTVNDSMPVDYLFDKEEGQKVIELPIPQDAHDDIKISISLPDAVSPKDLEVNEDIRRLGIMVKSIKFS